MQVINPKTEEIKDIEECQLQGLINRGWVVIEKKEEVVKEVKKTYNKKVK